MKPISEEARRQREQEGQARAAAVAANHRAALLAKVVREMGPRFGPERVSLHNCEVKHKGQRQTLDRVRGLAARLPDAVSRGESIVFYGSPGGGKDHLMAALLHVAAGTHGLRCAWTSGLTLYQRFRACVGGDEQESVVTRKLVEPDVLAVSDPVPGGDPSTWSLNRLHHVIDLRYNRVRPVWVTMNILNEDEAEERLTAQLRDRLRDGGHLIPCFWPNPRQAVK